MILKFQILFLEELLLKYLHFYLRISNKLA